MSSSCIFTAKGKVDLADACSTCAPSPATSPVPSPPWTRQNSPSEAFEQEAMFTQAQLEEAAASISKQQPCQHAKGDVLLAVSPQKRFGFSHEDTEEEDEEVYFALSVRRWALHNTMAMSG
mmetsp:Transcript_18592/g.41442  ORF Transcript_18592/g.41442 Transcript_18592/m.41442 type:complete len:121 (+) Transcript_18592:87-449(+)